MFPFDAILVGCDPALESDLRGLLHTLEVHVEAAFLGVESAIDALRLKAVMDRPAARGPAPGPFADPRGGEGSRGTIGEARRLFIVHLESPPDFNHLRRLSGVFPGQPIVAVLSGPNQAPTVLSAMRAGASQVVFLPLNGEDFRAALSCIAVQAYSQRQGRVIAVAGVTGGAGTTTLAITLADAFAHYNRLRSVLVELSLPVGKLPVYLDIRPKQTIHTLLRDVKKLDLHQVSAALTAITDGFSVLVGPHEAVATSFTSASDVLVLADSMRQLADVVVLDVPCTYDRFYFDILNAADEIVLIAEQKVPSIRALQMISSNLAHKVPHLVLNRYDPAIKGFGVARLMDLLRVPRILTVANDYEAVSSAINKGKLLRLEAPRSKVVADVQAIAKALTPAAANDAASKQVGSVFAGLMRVFGLK